MINLEAFSNLETLPTQSFADKPTTLTPGQKEASTPLWESADGRSKVGILECTPGQFTADRTAAGEYCHIISGRATVSNTDNTNSRTIEPGDILVLPKGWVGKWIIHEHMRKFYVIDS